MSGERRSNPILLTDSYKVTHWRQYPPGTEFVYSYFESRGGGFADVVFFGLQPILERHLEGTVVEPADVDEAEGFFTAHFGDASLFKRAGWQHVLDVRRPAADVDRGGARRARGGREAGTWRDPGLEERGPPADDLGLRQCFALLP